MDSLLLITHATALFPMMVFLWSWKRRKDTASVFMFIKFIYAVTYSLLYHSHHSLPDDKVFTTDYDYDNWALLDGYAASALIFTTVLYALRVREPQFYITSFAVENIVLVVYLWEQLDHALILTWYLSVCSAIVCILKWRTIWRYLLRFKCLSFLSIVCGITAIIVYCIAVKEWYNEVYIKYHSMWHCFVFLTGGFVSLLRYNLDEQLYPISRRAHLDSI
uniref:Post-GPI attachment to proteins factor 3 n=1 Tax=viral metagenome TaxID=1070528 RepID=A0A6C0CN90_9ZZZZ